MGGFAGHRVIGGALILAGLALLGASAYASLSSRLASPCPHGCNVILIVVDALAAEHLEAYGYGRDTMPRTTAFFEKRGVIFDDVTSGASWTFPSFAALYFSDVPSSISYSDYEGLTSRPQLFSALREAGTRIIGIQTFNNPVTGYFILDAVYGLIKENEKVRTYEPPLPETPVAEAKRAVEQDKIDAALGLLAQHEKGDAPFFMLLHFLLVHDPYAPAAPYDSSFSDEEAAPVVTMDMLLGENAKSEHASSTIEAYRLRYDQNIAQMDALLADFLASLSTTTLADTAIIITADHGESFDEHGTLYHGFSLYQAEVHVPLFMYVPGVSSRRISEPVSLLDIAPTILALRHAAVPESFAGISLVPLLEGRRLASRALPFEQGYPGFLNEEDVRPGSAVPPTLESAGVYGSDDPIVEISEHGARYGSYKLIVHDGPPPQEEFYDLAKDPQERANLLGAPLSEDAQRAYEQLHAALQ
jgi:arylsulfatase A-like enzyme